MAQASSTKRQQQVINLTVLSGPDSGMSRAFRGRPKIGVGRGTRNEFVLTDGFVSNRHGELIFDDDELVYRDLRSRHGSLVLVDDVSLHLQDRDEESQVRLSDGAEIQIGCTLIRVEISDDAVQQSAPSLEIDDPSGPTEELLQGAESRTSGGARETMITTSMREVQSIPGDLSSTDDRLGVLFRLAGELNSLTKLDDILELIVDAVFDAFPAANFFAITLADSPDEITSTRPFLNRVRGELPGQTDDQKEPILSTSILRQVVETRESVLFVKDSLGAQVSQSILDAQITACLCAPLVGQRSLLGVMQVDTRGLGSLFSRHDLNLFSVFASNVAFALERARLSENIVEMFESFVEASVNAIEARDPTTAGHSERVASYTLELAETVNSIEVGELGDIYMDRSELKELRYAALLHDFGKIAVREDVLRKGKRLPELHLELIQQRFETIKALSYQRMVRGHFGKTREPATPELFHRIEQRYEKFCAELDGIVNWLFEVAAAPGLDPDQIERVKKIGRRTFLDAHGHEAAYLTDEEIENLTIPRGTLNNAEWENMRAHAQRSQDYLERIPWGDELAQVPCIAGAHHEKLDGSGYPAGLGAAEIIPQVRMLTIADIFDALTAADRPYRKAASPDRAVAILQEEADQRKLDRDLVTIFSKKVLPKIITKIPGHGR